MIGWVLDGTYRVLERLGAGGMGEVFLVEHIQLGRREAIKVLREELAGDVKLAQRFRREARAINRLRHPNIIGIYDFGQLPDGRLYIAMELAAGIELDQLLRGAPDHRIELGRALHFIHQLAGAIDHAHAQGVVHRDLKPSNLMVSVERGRPDVLKILDFGLAKVLNPAGGGDELTAMGEVFGTPEYLAPERLGGGPDDPRSDLYAIGCILFELISGLPPFHGPHVFVLAQHMTATPAKLSQTLPGVPPMVDLIIEQLMAKVPGDRFQSGRQLQSALEQVPGYPRRRPGTTNMMMVAPVPRPPDLDRTMQASPHAIASAALTVEDIREELCGTLVELATAALAEVPGDQTIAAALYHVNGVRDERQRLVTARAELEEHQAHAIQAAREREGSLRFAIADLRFDRMRTPDPIAAADVDFQIEALAYRVKELSWVVHRELQVLDEHGARLTQVEVDVETRWLASHRYLRDILAARLPGGGLRDRYQAFRGALDQVL